ncbi:MAG: hypothetical protein ACYTGP_07210 [Planctomycetota bacterium]
MAVRSGAGTGVIVSLVVFVLTTVFLLILSIIFYAGKTQALEQRQAAIDDLAKYVKGPQRASDLYKGFEREAGANAQTVSQYLNKRYENAMRFFNGEVGTELEQVKAEFSRHGVGDDDTVRGVLESTRRQLRQAEVRIEGQDQQIQDRDDELNEKQAQIDQMKENHEREMEQATREIQVYREYAQTYGNDVVEAIEDMNARVERCEDQRRMEVDDLQEELDGVNQELVLMRARVDEYEAIFDKIRTKATRPDLLVDGQIIDVDPGQEQVYINRGKKDRIVLGMTFEVYDDAASIRVDERTGVLPRGKASLQVVKVADGTATCKLTRTVPGRPVVRNNVIANAIYDPDYRFKFMIHGKFDVDGDGRATKEEADHLASLVIKWGGEIVEGDELPGDLDFLVLGQMPPMPAALPANATDAQTRVWVEKRAARLRYEELFKRASEAQIPVLNANRFFVLIGRTNR